MSKVFLVEMTITIPVVAEDEEAAIQMVCQDQDQMATEAFTQAQEALAEGDESDIRLGALEVTAEDLDGGADDWRDVVPFGDESEATIEERLLGLNESEEGVWGEPDHVDD